MTELEDRELIRKADHAFGRAVGLVIANARPEDPALHPALLWCRRAVCDTSLSFGTLQLLEDALFGQLLSSLANPYALVHSNLWSDILSNLSQYEPKWEDAVRKEFNCHLRRASATLHVLLLLKIRICNCNNGAVDILQRHAIANPPVSTLNLIWLLDHPNEYVRAQCLQVISRSTRPFNEFTIFLPRLRRMLLNRKSKGYAEQGLFRVFLKLFRLDPDYMKSDALEVAHFALAAVERCTDRLVRGSPSRTQHSFVDACKLVLELGTGNATLLSPWVAQLLPRLVTCLCVSVHSEEQQPQLQQPQPPLPLLLSAVDGDGDGDGDDGEEKLE